MYKYILVDKVVTRCDDLHKWAMAMEDRTNMVVKQETLEDGLFVSTVFLGLDSGYNPERPLVFETMIFPKDENRNTQVIDRYTTYQEALDGHDAYVKTRLQVINN